MARYTMHYAGQKYKLDTDPSDDLKLHEPGTVRLNIGEGKWLTFATGPGIPILVEEMPESGTRNAVFL